MKKLFAAAFMMAFFASGCLVVDDSCECMYEDPPTCINGVDLGASCDNDCDWDVVDCDDYCYGNGYAGGYCAEGVVEDYCSCEY